MDHERVKKASYAVCAIMAALPFDEAVSVLGIVLTTVLEAEPDTAYRKVMAEEFARRLVNAPGPDVH